MDKQRLRPSVFPGCAPYLTFLSPEEEYGDGQEPLDGLAMSFTAPTGTSPPILECFQRFGFSIVEVISFVPNAMLYNGSPYSGQPVTCVI